MPTWGKSHKIPVLGGSGNFQVGEHIHTGRITHPNATGTEDPVFRTLPDLAQCFFSSDFSSISFIIFFNKLVNLSVSRSSVSRWQEGALLCQGRVEGPKRTSRNQPAFEYLPWQKASFHQRRTKTVHLEWRKSPLSPAGPNPQGI